MVTAYPRWEWRTFGTTFGGADKRIGDLASTSRATRETYVLCDASEAAVTIGDGALDVKLPIRRDADGLELWSPHLTSAFPLEGDALAAVFAAWNLPAPQQMRPTYDDDTFMSEIVWPQPALTPVNVVKQRQEGLFDGCHIEVADVWFEGYPLRTIAVEMEDPQQVLRTVRALGLSGYENVNYIRALRRHLMIRGRTLRMRAQRARPNRSARLEARSHV